MARVLVKNVSPGSRGIIVSGDYLATIIEPGEATELELSEAEVADAKETGWFELEPVRAAKAKAEKDDG